MVLLTLVCWSCTRQEFSQRTTTFTGTVAAGDAYAKPFGSGLVFYLEPMEYGWVISIIQDHRDITALTPPLRGPNPRDIEGWNFRNSQNTGPNQGDVNVPQERRDFIFSPEGGTTIQGPVAHCSPTPEEIEHIRQWGNGSVSIDALRLDDPDPSQRAHILSMHFTATLRWTNRPLKTAL
jgi:hypothetical protein